MATVLGAVMAIGLAGCGDFSPPTPPGKAEQDAGQVGLGSTSTTVAPSGINKDKFDDAWEKIKDIMVATATATALSDFRSRVNELGAALDAAGRQGLNTDEKGLWIAFDDVYRAYADSAALWAADIDADFASEGIPIYRDGRPLLPRAAAIVALYGLTVKQSRETQGVDYVPDDSVGRLWDVAQDQTEDSLLPVLHD